MQIEIYNNINDLEPVSSSWNHLVEKQAKEIDGPGPTSTFDCVRLLCETHLPDSSLNILVAREDGNIRGIMPLYNGMTPFSLGERQELATVPGLYPVRVGLIAEPGYETKFATELLGTLRDIDARWDVLLLNAVSGSTSDKALQDAVDRLSMEPYPVDSAASPYMQLPESSQHYRDSMSSKLAKNIRWCARRLDKIGDLTMETVTDSGQVEGFLSDLTLVEKSSWKEDSLTSLTTNPRQMEFHEKLAPVAARNKWLRSYVLRVGEKAVAYQFGLLFSGTYYLLKTSYANDLGKFSPGSVLTHRIIEDLCDAEDKVNLFDFMGKCEQYKMRWTSDTYTRQVYAIHNLTWRGHLHKFRGKLSASLRRTTKPAGA